MEELLTPQEAAERLKVSLYAVYKMVERGDLKVEYLKTPRSEKRGLMRLRAAEVAAYKPNANKVSRPKKRRVHAYHAVHNTAG